MQTQSIHLNANPPAANHTGNTQTTTPDKLAQQKKMALLLPLFVIPIAALLFFLLGGGSEAVSQENQKQDSGLNTFVPQADTTELELEESKLEAYEKARRDTLEKAKKLALSDYIYEFDQIAEDSEVDDQPTGLNMDAYRPLGKKEAPDSLTLILQDDANPVSAGYYAQARYEDSRQDETLAKLDALIALLEAQLEHDLHRDVEKHIEDSLKKAALTPPAKEVKSIVELPSPKKEVVSKLNNSEPQDSSFAEEGLENRFYGLSESSTEGVHNTIRAVIHGDQTISSGATVKMRLLTDIEVNQRLVPRGSFLFGTATLQGERIQISIESLQYGGNLFEVALKAFGLDGLPGIYIPGSLTRDAAKDALTETTDDTVEEDILGESTSGQVASTLIKGGKSLFGKKVKLMKVTLKAGTQILLL